MIQNLFCLFLIVICIPSYAQVKFNEKEKEILLQVYEMKIAKGNLSESVTFEDYLSDEASISLKAFRSNKKTMLESTPPFHRLQFVAKILDFQNENAKYFISAIDYNSLSPAPLHVNFGSMLDGKKTKGSNRVPFKVENIMVRSVKVNDRVGFIISATNLSTGALAEGLVEIHIEFDDIQKPFIKSLFFYDPYLEEKYFNNSAQLEYQITRLKIQQESTIEYLENKYIRFPVGNEIKDPYKIRSEFTNSLFPLNVDPMNQSEDAAVSCIKSTMKRTKSSGAHKKRRGRKYKF